ncbi:MAG: family 43 glycosylhydrolase [Pseudomonadota bacterium]
MSRWTMLGFCIAVIGGLNACQLEGDANDSTRAKDDFVGGVVVKHRDPIVLKETITEREITVKPNDQGVSEFKFSGKPLSGKYNVTIVSSGDQNCTLENGSGTYNNFPVFDIKVLCEDENGTRWSGNPIVRNMYTADPSVLVEGDTLYMYAGRDETSFFHVDPARCGTACAEKFVQLFSDFNITGIHIFKTTNMVDWSYVGPAIHAKDTTWMSQTWASQIAKKGDKYYLYTCSPVKVSVGLAVVFQNIMAALQGKEANAGPYAEVGVAVSDSPEGPFVDIGQSLVKQGMPNAGPSIMDPTVSFDDNGDAYLFYGGGGVAKYVKLGDDMVSLDGDIKDVRLSDGSTFPGFTEGPHMHQQNGKYYLSYSASKAFNLGPLRYAMADSVHGPWTYKGDYLGDVKITTNHGSIARFKGNDYAFYHTGLLPGITTFFGALAATGTRAVSLDKLEYTDNGEIKFVEQTRVGVKEF